MSQHYPALTVIIPLIGALLAPLAAYLSKGLVRLLSITAVFAAFLTSAAALVRALAEGTWHYVFAGWAPPWGIEYVIDPLSGGITVLITFIGFMVAIYGLPFLKEETWLKQGLHYALYLLIISGLLGMVSTGDLFNLYVFLEISSLATYGLIASGGYRSTVAAFRYLIIGTAGASFYLLGIGYLYGVTGTLNMADMAERLQPIMDSPAVIIGLVLIFIGLGLKMALFPMHGWLPDAYTFAPPAVIPFIAGVATKVPAYVLLRMFFHIVEAGSGPVPAILGVIGWVAALGIILGSVMAIAQSDFRRMLAYSSVAQVGYIALGFAIGNTYGLIGAVLHIFNHAIMKSCLFLVAGGVKWRTGQHSISRYLELSGRMPLTMGAFAIAAMSMVGLPPTAGFFSKWYLVLGAINAGKWPFIVVIILSSLLNAVYFFRVIENSFIKKHAGDNQVMEDRLKNKKGFWELPTAMLIPIVVLGVGILLLGIFNEQIVSQVLQYTLPGGGQ